MIDDETAMIRDTAERLFTDNCERETIAAAWRGEWPATLWDEIEATGLTKALVSEEKGGAGLPVGAALTLIEVAGEFAVPVPLAETMIAAWLLDRAGIEPPQGPLTFALLDGGATPGEGGWKVDGVTRRVPWGRSARLVGLVDGGNACQLVLFDEGAGKVEKGANAAGEPRDTVSFDTFCDNASVVNSPVSSAELHAIGAAMRTMQMTGALRRATALTLQYAQDRKQFGRPLSKFQAVQQNLAVLATQCAAAAMAATMARDALVSDELLPNIAIAKARTGEAAGVAAAIAHQVHGAIGFTLEHDLQFYTKRLYSWRDEFGNEGEWNRLYGRRLAANGADGLWPAITNAA